MFLKIHPTVKFRFFEMYLKRGRKKIIPWLIIKICLFLEILGLILRIVLVLEETKYLNELCKI